MNNKRSLSSRFIKSTLVALSLTASLDTMAAFNTNPPATGALNSGTYRDLSAEMGKTDAATKRNDAWSKMFGTDTNYRLYWDYGATKAYILNPADGGDIRTEGQSWGMTTAVMMNKQAEFDKLWRFAVDHQRNTDGTFAWLVKFDADFQTYKKDTGPAPDGELYFAFALLNADARWGSNSTGIDYYGEAMAVLSALRNKLMINNLIIFSPFVANVTDPSYHIPAFYNYFANRVAAQADKDYWNGAATASRTFLQNHMSTAPNGLPTYLASPSGTYLTGSNLFTGQPNPAQQYEYDAWRVALNIALDAHMSGAQTWHKNAINTILYFLKDKHTTTGCYMQKYEYGAAVATNNYCADVGQKAANAVALLASTNSSDASFFFDQFWSSSFPSGEHRYYGGALHMLSMLHATGQFKFYMPTAGVNKLLNSNFASNLNSWYGSKGGTAAATFTWLTGGAKITITAAGANTYDVQFSQNTTITAGKSYKLEFDARITEGSSRTIGANIEKAASPYTQYGTSTHSLTTSWKHFTKTFTAVSATDNGARVVFQLGANANDVMLDNVTLVQQ